MKTNELTPSESIQIIKNMVAQTRESLESGGICGILIACAMFIFNTFDVQVPLFALLFVVMMIIPGHVINCAGKCSKS